jgi:hypothetical protein
MIPVECASPPSSPACSGLTARFGNLPGTRWTQRWEGSCPRPAAAGPFPKPRAFNDQGRKYTAASRTPSRRAGIRLRQLGRRIAPLTTLRRTGSAPSLLAVPRPLMLTLIAERSSHDSLFNSHLLPSSLCAFVSLCEICFLRPSG